MTEIRCLTSSASDLSLSALSREGANVAIQELQTVLEEWFW